MDEMERKNHVGPAIRSLNNVLMRKMDALAWKAGDDASLMVYGWMLGYLHMNQDKDVYQKDLEKEFRLSRAAVTCILKSLEEKACIKRESVVFDARLKRIVLLPKGIEIHEKSFENVKLMEKLLRKDISEEELEVFLKVASKMKKNMLETGYEEE